MADAHHGMNVAARVEICLELHPYRIGSLNQIIENAISHLLMRARLIAIAIDVKLDRLELNHLGTGLIDQAQHSEVWVTRERTLAGELRQFDRDLVGPTGPGVLKSDQLGLGNGTFAVLRRLGLLFNAGSGQGQLA